MEVGPQAVTHTFKALRAQSKEVPFVRVSAESTRKLFIPARALSAGQELARNYREQLQKEIQQNEFNPRKRNRKSVY